MQISVSLRAIVVLAALGAAGDARAASASGATLTDVNAIAPPAVDTAKAAVPGTDAPANPAPSPYALLLAGLGAVGWLARQRREPR
jgi:hypothetical protein